MRASSDGVLIYGRDGMRQIPIPRGGSVPGRREVLSEPGNFPSDLYVIDGALRGMADRSVRLEPAHRLIDCISEDTALVLLTQVHYKSAAMHDMRAITARAHEKGALVLWDLSHSAGALHVDLNGCDADFAVGCGYKQRDKVT